MGVLAFLQSDGARWWLLCLIAALCYFVISTVYSIWFGPLAKYPGPLLAKISAAPSFYHAFKGDRHIWMWQCFQIYGNKVRIHPNGLVFCSPQAYRDIYSLKSNVKKSKFYEVWSRNEADINTLSTTDVELHAKKRRLLNHAFTEKTVRAACTYVVKHVDRWNELLLDGDGKTWSEPKNLTEWTDYLTFDIMGELSFGRSFNIKEPEDNPLKGIPHAIVTYTRFFYPITKSPLLDTIVWLKPRGLNYLLELMTPKQARMYYKFVEQSVSDRRKLEEQQQQANAEGKEVRQDLFHFLFQAKHPDTGKPAYSETDLLAEANLFIVAGSHTTAIALSGFFFYITRNPRVYAKLVKEIRDTFATVEDIVGGPTLSSCQYLRACIDETMRISPSGSSELSRRVLPGGINIDGDFLPAGVDVGTSGFCNGRSEEIWGDPGVFRPERWIVSEETNVTVEDVARLRSMHHPFLTGPGSCAGKNIAMLEMTVTIARTLHRLEVRQAPGHTLGEGAPSLGWGRRHRNQFQVIDAYISIRDGPMVQFRRRES